MLLPGSSIIDYDVQVNNGEWVTWTTKVPTVRKVRKSSKVLCSWLSEHKSLMLCGPPGSGKTMTLCDTFRKLLEVVDLLKTFEQYYIERHLTGL